MNRPSVAHRHLGVVHAGKQHVAALLQVEHPRLHLLCGVQLERRGLLHQRIHVVDRVAQQLVEDRAEVARVHLEFHQQVVVFRLLVVFLEQVNRHLLFADQVEPLLATL